MRLDEYLNTLREDYEIVRRLSEKVSSSSVVLRHRTLGRLIVLHRFPERKPVYEWLRTVCHPNLPLLYETAVLEDAYVVLEEYLDGLSTAEVLEGGCYTVHGAKRVLCGVCDALTALHAAGFLHRDVKPENVMIAGDGTVKLIDFDVAKPLRRTGGEPTAALGTIGYAPPEQMGLAPTDERTDVYAAGVLLNVLLTGRHPSERLAPGRAGRIVRRCTEISPDSRVRSAAALKRLLTLPF